MNSERIAEIRSLSSETKDKAILLRCEAVIRWLEDTPKIVVAEELECSWTFVKKWVDKWKTDGAQSLFQKSWVGRTPIIPYERRGELRTKIRVFFQNHPEKTVSDLKDFIDTQGFKLGLSSTYNLLDDLGISYQKPRPFSPKQDKNAMEDFKKKFKRK